MLKILIICIDENILYCSKYIVGSFSMHVGKYNIDNNNNNKIDQFHDGHHLSLHNVSKINLIISFHDHCGCSHSCFIFVNSIISFVFCLSITITAWHSKNHYK